MTEPFRTGETKATEVAIAGRVLNKMLKFKRPNFGRVE
jgi:hypothetical protein